MDTIETIPEPTAPAPEAKQPTQEEIKAKSDASALAARIAELKTFKGHTFVRTGTKFPVITVKDYAGTRIHQEYKDGKAIGIQSHVFAVEDSFGHRWTPPATLFLAEHEEIQVEPTEPQPTII